MTYMTNKVPRANEVIVTELPTIRHKIRNGKGLFRMRVRNKMEPKKKNMLQFIPYLQKEQPYLPRVVGADYIVASIY